MNRIKTIPLKGVKLTTTKSVDIFTAEGLKARLYAVIRNVCMDAARQRYTLEGMSIGLGVDLDHVKSIIMIKSYKHTPIDLGTLIEIADRLGIRFTAWDRAPKKRHPLDDD